MEEDILPTGWLKGFDQQYNCFYYYNSITGISQWESPLETAILPGAQDDTYFNRTGLDCDIPYYSDIDETNDDDSKKDEGLASNPYYSDMENSPMRKPSRSQLPLREGSSSQSRQMADISRKAYVDISEKYSDADDLSLRGPNNHEGKASENIKVFSSSSSDMGLIANGMRNNGRSRFDYIGNSKLYKLQRKYMDEFCKELCILCRTNQVSEAFFPCDHRCVCHACVVKYDICEFSSALAEIYKDCHYNCPLCASLIRKILPMEDGNEREKYWLWCNEVVLPLPPGFAKRFAHAAEALQRVYVDEMEEKKNLATQRSSTCFIT